MYIIEGITIWRYKFNLYETLLNLDLEILQKKWLLMQPQIAYRHLVEKSLVFSFPFITFDFT